MQRALKILIIFLILLSGPVKAESGVYQQALSLSSAKSLKMAFDVFYGAADWENAYQVARAGVEKFPENVFWLDKLIDLSLWTNRYKESYDYFERLWQLAKNNPAFYNRFLYLAGILKRYDVIVRLIESRAVSREKLPLKQLIHAYRKAGRPFALMDLLQRLYTQKKAPSIRKELVKLYMQFDRYAKAFQLLRSLPLNTLSYEEATVLAYIYFLRGKIDNALNTLLWFEKQKGSDPVFMRAIANLALRRARYRLAANYLSKLPNLSREQRNFLFQYYFYVRHDLKYARKYTNDAKVAQALLRTGQWDKLVYFLSQMPKETLYEKKLETVYLTALLKTNQTNEAMEILEYAFKKKYAKIDELDLLASLYKRHGRWKKLYDLRRAMLKDLADKKKLGYRQKLIKAHCLQDLNRMSEARNLFGSLVKTKSPEVILDYLDTAILEPKRWKKWLKFTEQSLLSNQNPDIKRLYDAKYAYWLSWKGEYEQAFRLIEKYDKDDPTLTLDIARYQALAGKRKDAVSFLEEHLEDSSHTDYEKRLIRWQLVDTEDVFRNMAGGGITYRDSSGFGWRRKGWICSRLYFNENLLEADFLNLISRPKLEYHDRTYHHLQREKGLNIGWKLLSGPDYAYAGKLYLLQEGNCGASFNVNDTKGDLSGNISISYNKPEDDVTPLSYLWALKRGIESELTLKYSTRILLGLKAGWRDFKAPEFVRLVHGEKLGHYANFEPYVISLHTKGNELYWQYVLGTILFKGKETGGLTPLIPDYMIMPSFTFSGTYVFGNWPHKFTWVLTPGYLLSKSNGATYKGWEITGRVELDWPLGRLFTLKSYVGRGIDIQHGGGVIEAGLSFQKKFGLRCRK